MKKIRYWTQIIICAVSHAMIASGPSPSPSMLQNRPHPHARGKPAVIDALVDLHELSPMSFYRTLPSGRLL